AQAISDRRLVDLERSGERPAAFAPVDPEAFDQGDIEVVDRTVLMQSAGGLADCGFRSLAMARVDQLCHKQAFRADIYELDELSCYASCSMIRVSNDTMRRSKSDVSAALPFFVKHPAIRISVEPAWMGRGFAMPAGAPRHLQSGSSLDSILGFIWS
ncbi:MAG TPA: hypothetical protein VE485_01440, partial [Mycobacterium sp.]|nr:hypothetical protein [Mycobacterium sp.]